LVYAFVGKPARRVPVVGPYLAGIIAVAGYMGCVLGPIAAVGGGDPGEGDLAASLGSFAFVSVLFGLLVGHKWFRPAKDATWRRRAVDPQAHGSRRPPYRRPPRPGSRALRGSPC
jgi:hypothetical protein